MKRIRITSPARRDLREIRIYLAKYSPEAASRIIQEIRTRLTVLADQPGIGHARVDLTNSDVLFLSVWSYLVIYRVTITEVQILRVVHGARDLESFLDQELN